MYSVISPEGCAAILWRSSEKAETAADALKFTAQDLLELKVIDQIIIEPTGGAQRQPKETVQRVGLAVAVALTELEETPDADFRAMRREKIPGNGQGRVSLTRSDRGP